MSWDELVQRSDFRSLHVPLGHTTRHLVDAACARSNEADGDPRQHRARDRSSTNARSVCALGDGRLAGAGLDVYEHEPALTPGLADLPNVVLLPHLGSATTQVRARMAALSAEQRHRNVGGSTSPALRQSGGMAVKVPVARYGFKGTHGTHRAPVHLDRTVDPWGEATDAI